jgi:hypothetical protein
MAKILQQLFFGRSPYHRSTFDGSKQARFLFQTAQEDRVMRDILEFLPTSQRGQVVTREMALESRAIRNY